MAALVRTQAAVARAASLRIDDVRKLPWVFLVDHCVEKIDVGVEWRPVGIDPAQLAKIGRLNLETAAEIHLVGLDNSS
jgi:hypothetical protein